MFRQHYARVALAISAIGTFAGMAVFVGPGVAQAASETLFVSTTGSDTGACTSSSAPCATIDYALTQATPNAAINVAAGTYTQQLVITQNTTILGAAGGGTIIDPTSIPTSETDTGRGIPVSAIVDVRPHVNLVMKNVVVDGSGAQSQFTDCSQNFTGVYYHDAIGQLKKDTVENIELAPSLFGCQDGYGVYAATDTGSTSSVQVNAVKVSAYQKNGIVCRGVGTSCGVDSSTVTGVGPTSQIAQNGIEMYEVFSAEVQGNTVSGNSYTGGGASNQATGLLLFDIGSLTATSNTLTNNDIDAYVGSDGTNPTNQTGYFVTDNTMSNATDKVPGGALGYGDGIQIDSASAPVTVSGNTILGSAENGISLLGVSNATVSGNSATKDVGDGIYVGGPGSVNAGGSSNNTVSNNTVKKNGQAGISAASDSSANAFNNNIGTSNTRYDFEDLGTSNSWMGNTCTPVGDSSPAGLC